MVLEEVKTGFLIQPLIFRRVPLTRCRKFGCHWLCQCQTVRHWEECERGERMTWINARLSAQTAATPSGPAGRRRLVTFTSTACPRWNAHPRAHWQSQWHPTILPSFRVFPNWPVAPRELVVFTVLNHYFSYVSRMSMKLGRIADTDFIFTDSSTSHLRKTMTKGSW